MPDFTYLVRAAKTGDAGKAGYEVYNVGRHCVGIYSRLCEAMAEARLRNEFRPVVE